MYQKYIIAGNLVADATQRFTQTQKSVVSFRVITSKKVNGKDYAFAIDVSLWGKLGEALVKYLKKGQSVLVEGELRQETWEKDGQTHYKTAMNAEQVRLLGGKRSESTQQQPAQNNQAAAPQPQQAPVSNDPFDTDF